MLKFARAPFLRSMAVAVLAVCATTAVMAADGPDDTLVKARTALDAHHPDEAYRLLAPLEADLGGSEDYDYLLGIAALDSGHAGEAVFSLERVLTVDPTFLGARMELGRALYESGDVPGARAQFQFLAAQSPPPATRQIIASYLAALDQRSAGTRHEWRGYFDAGAGYDTNANGATHDDQFLGFLLDPKNVEADSSFVDLATGFNQAVGFANGSALVTSGRLGHRFNPDAGFVDLTTASLGTQLQWSWAGTRLDLGVGTDFDWLDGRSHQRDLAVDLRLGHRIAGDWDVSLDARYAGVRFAQSALEVMDVNRWLAALGLTRNNIGEHRGSFGVAALVGSDDAQRDASPYGNERFGGRLWSGWSLSPTASLYLELAYLDTNYDGTPGFFGVDRADRQWSALIATDYRDWPRPGWSLAPRIRYVKNDSNVSLYEFDRTEAGIYLRRSFR